MTSFLIHTSSIFKDYIFFLDLLLYRYCSLTIHSYTENTFGDWFSVNGHSLTEITENYSPVVSVSESPKKINIPYSHDNITSK